MTFQPLVPYRQIAPTEEKRAELRDLASSMGFDPAEVDKGIARDMQAECYGNDTYIVIVDRDANVPEGVPPMTHLSIRRKDRGTLRDWRDLQAIKTQLVGAECEGVELFPAESRVVDTANQYHLWVFNDAKAAFPFGFKTGLRSDASVGGGKQRKGSGQ